MGGASQDRAVILLSGVLDSATTLALAREAGFEAHALTVRYGQRHEVEVERSADGFEVTVDGTRHSVDLICLDGAVASLRYAEDGRSFHVTYQYHQNRHWRLGVGDREFHFEVLTPVEAIDATAAAEAGLG